jgi:hypothetical protein
MDWNALGAVHVFHEGIIPNGVYYVQAVEDSCQPDCEAGLSDPLSIPTAIWGDTLEDCELLPDHPCSAPDGIINIVDVTQILSRFVSDPLSITKTRAELEPGCADLLINISDVLHAQLGFEGIPYPFVWTTLDPCDSPCANPLPR